MTKETFTTPVLRDGYVMGIKGRLRVLSKPGSGSMVIIANDAGELGMVASWLIEDYPVGERAFRGTGESTGRKKHGGTGR